MFDEFDVYEDGVDRTFGGIKMTWMGVVPVEELEKGVTKGHYVPGYIYRNNQFKFNKGSEIYLLDAPDGEVFVMQSFTNFVQKDVTIDNIRDLGRKTHAAAGLEVPLRGPRSRLAGQPEAYQQPRPRLPGRPEERLPGLRRRQGIQLRSVVCAVIAHPRSKFCESNSMLQTGRSASRCAIPVEGNAARRCSRLRRKEDAMIVLQTNNVREKMTKTLIVGSFLILLAVPLVAQEKPIAAPGTQVATEQTAAAAENAEALRKAAQNPVASLISVPVQNNNNFNIGPDGRTQDILNIQPVIPVRVSANWNLITRVITPVIYQPTVSQPVNQGAYGFGDLNPSFFFSPAKAHKIIWGAGPALLLPTATNRVLGQGKWGAGPTLVVLSQPGKWTLGGLVNNVFSFAGQSSRADVNQMLFQYFINYNMKHGYYITWQPTITANWEATNGGRWVVPFGGGLGRIMKLGFQPVNVTAQFYGNAVHPPALRLGGCGYKSHSCFPSSPRRRRKR